MKTIWVYPGQGVQKPNMLHELPDSAVTTQFLQRASAALAEDVMLLDRAEALNNTRAVQLCLLLAGVISSEILFVQQLRPDYVAGLSIGAWAAAVVAGVLQFEDAVRLVALRGELMQSAYPDGYGMTAMIGASRGQVETWVNQAQQQGLAVYIANINAHNQIVISGANTAMQYVAEIAKPSGVVVKRLAVSMPSHCELLREQAVQLEQAMQNVRFDTAKIGYISSSTARLIRDPHVIRHDLANNMARIVEWENTVQAAWEREVKLQIEMLPGTVLTGLSRRIMHDGTTVAFQGTRLDNMIAIMQKENNE
ncbi:MAG: malonate decarboxylase subunit epsilon [Acinetobacter sp.]